MFVVETHGLCRTYKQKRQEATQALVDVNLAIPPGEVHSFLGPNGAGKTTLCKILSTILLPSEGQAIVGGFDVVTAADEVKRRVGVVFGGDRGLYERLTARQNLRLWSALYGLAGSARRRRVDELLARVGLSGRADDLVQTLSRGMRQRLHIARGLVASPSVLILDEPTAGMDPVAARDVRALVWELRGEGCTLLLTTHDMGEAATLSDRVSLLDGGRLVLTDSPDAVRDLLGSYHRLDARQVPAELAAQVARMEGITVEEATNGVVQISAAREEDLSAVLMLLAQAGVTDVARHRPSLEDVYVQLIGDRGMGVGR